MSCSSDDSPAVSIEKGKISLTGNGETNIYNILSVQSVIKGDTTTIVIRAENKDSTSEVLVIGFQRMINFRVKKYDITGIFDYNPDTTFVYSYLHYEDQIGYIDIHFPKGTVDVVDYFADNSLMAKLSFEFPDLEDTTKKIEITGELNLDYAAFDPEKVENLPISPGSMMASVNDSATTFKAVAAHITTFGQNKYSINGTSGTKTVVIELVDFTPKINTTYKIGDKIDTLGSIRASYSINNETTFWADTGNIKISKITPTTIQGYFNFASSLSRDARQKKILKDGMFYAKMKNQR